MGVGVQKSGTTSLHVLLKNHTNLELPHQKELHFFDNDNLDWAKPDYSAYHQNFSNPERVWGEITPIYIYMPGCLERLRAYSGDIRIVTIFRDPIDRAYSHWRMERSRGAEILTFSEAIREDGRQRLGSAGWHRVFSYVERGFYGRQVAHLFSLFPRSNLLFLDYELLKHDQSSLLRRVTEFVGGTVTSQPCALVHSHIGTGDAPGPSEEDTRYLAAVYRSDFDLFREQSGLGCNDWRMRRLERC